MGVGVNGNLIPITERDPETRREWCRKGAAATNAKRRERKTLKEDLLIVLESRQAKIIAALCDKAEAGDTRAVSLIADLINENGIAKTADVTDAVKAEASDRDALLDALKGAG